MAQLADEARTAAARDVAKLLALPEDLARVPSLRADFAQKLTATEAHLSTTVQTQARERGGRGCGEGIAVWVPQLWLNAVYVAGVWE